jgi:hypothetical protein
MLQIKRSRSYQISGRAAMLAETQATTSEYVLDQCHQTTTSVTAKNKQQTYPKFFLNAKMVRP